MRTTALLAGLLWLPLAQASTLLIDDAELELRAQARACYLGFIQLYDVDYYVGESGDRCVRVAYLRGFSEEQLGEATTKVFAKRHGETVAAQYDDLLDQINAAYEPVNDGDVYTYCVNRTQGAGLLLRDGQPVKRVPVDDFAERFLQIWVGGETADGKPDWNFGSC